MTRPSGSPAVDTEHFSLPLFLLTVAGSLTGLAALVKLVAPQAVWRAQLGASPWTWAAAFAAVTLLNCFIEYFFHRYVLHKPLVSFLSRFYRQHTLHHNLTRIGRRRTPGGREIPYVENVFPITEPEQREASFFPWYTLAVFAALITPLLALVQWLMPAWPWFFAGYAALAGSLVLYEVFHAIEHLPFARWVPLLEHPRWGWFWRKVYSFHLRHHAVIDCNEAISGFFTLPVADWVFGTFVLPRTLYADGAEWQGAEFTHPRPYALIRWCDDRAAAIVQRRRARAQTAPAPARIPEEDAVYTRGEQIAHGFTHGAGLVASVAAFLLLLILACLRGGAWQIATCVVFGGSLILLYAVFAHFGPARLTRGRKVFDGWKHAAVFFLVAGTATPFLLTSVRGPWGWSLFGVVWGLCAIGGGAQLFGPGRLRAVTVFAYASLGILALIAIKPVFARVPPGALWLLAAGALCYASGTIFHLCRRMRYHLVVRQAFAFGGSACHLLAVLLFVLPVSR